MSDTWDWKQLLLPALLLGALLINSSFIKPPNPLPADADLTDFSAMRAMEHVKKIAVKPHAAGTPENARVRAYLVETLKAAGLEVEIQSTQIIKNYKKENRPLKALVFQNAAASVKNIVARMKGTGQKGKALMLMSHYDSVYYGPGAGDDASGTATLLETLRALQASGPLENDVIFLMTDAEEMGLYGAQAFFGKHRWADDIGLILNFEARGSKGPVSMFQSSQLNDKLIAALSNSVDRPYGNSLAVEIYRNMPNDTDLSISLNAGIPGLNFAFVDSLYDYHTKGDNVENLSKATLQHMGDQALAMALAMGNKPLPLGDTSDTVFFDFLTLFMLSYPSWGAGIVAGLAILLFAVYAAKCRKQPGHTARGTLRAFAASFMFVALLALLVETLFLVIGGRSADFVEGRRLLALEDYQLAAFQLAGFGLVIFWFRMASVGMNRLWPIGGTTLSLLLFMLETSWIPAAAMLVLTAASYVLMRSPIGKGDRTLGSLAFVTLFALGVQFVAPTGSHVFFWPLIFVLVALIFMGRSNGTTKQKLLIFMAGGLLGALWLMFFAGVAYSSVGFFLPAVIVGFYGLLLLLLVPAFMETSDNSHSHVGTASMALAAMCIAYVSFAPGFSARLNQPTEVFYVIDTKGDGQNHFATRLKTLDPWAAMLIGEEAETMNVSAIAAGRTDQMRTSPAPATSTGKISISDIVTKDTGTAFTLMPGYRGDIVFVSMSSDAPITGATLNGETLTIDSGNTKIQQFDLYYFAAPETGLEIELNGIGEITVHATEITSDWPEDVAPNIPVKPETIMIAPYRWSDSTLSSVKMVLGNENTAE